MFSGDLLFAGLDRPHRPARRRPPDDAAQPAPTRCCRSPTTSWCSPGTASRPASAASAPTNPFLLDLLDDGPRPTPDPRSLNDHEQTHPAERVPRAAARSSGSSSSTSSTACAAPSSCTASPASRPAPSSRWTSCCARARPPRRSTSCAGCRPRTTSGARRRHGAALRPHRAVRALRAGERRQAGVPVPPLPDPEGLARRAAAGGPLPRVHPGRHRRGDARRAAVPLRRRGGAGDGRGALRAAAAADAPAGEQPQADRGLLPRASARPTRPRSSRSSTSSTSCRADAVRGLLRRDARAHRAAGRPVPGAGRDRVRGHLLRRAGPGARGRATSCSTPGSPS